MSSSVPFTQSRTRQDAIKALYQAAEERILILDGAMGTMIQQFDLTAEDYAGSRFSKHNVDVKGNNDLLSLTKPEVIRSIHHQYLDAGADILGTNTFNATTLSQADYALESIVTELNFESARIAREVADTVTESTGRQRWVAGAIGPTSRTASISPDVNDPGYRNVSFDELREAYAQAALALLEGGVDILIVETIFDTLNAKAALYAIDEVFDDIGAKWPVMISGTITDLSGRTLSGQTAEAFWNSMRHADPFSIGLNCALGAKDLRPHVAELARVSNVCVSAYPNAGLPNEFGGYDETPEEMQTELREWAQSGLLNIVGGCCGTTPGHIKAIAEAVEGVSPRALPHIPPAMRLSGLEPFEVRGLAGAAE